MNNLKTVILLGLLTGLFLLVGGMVGGRSGMLVALIMAAVMNFVSYWFSDKIVLHAYGAQELPENEAPRVRAMVQELAQKANIPVPKIYIIDQESSNAFATGRGPERAAIALTRGIMEAMNEEELKGVIGHELSHVLNRDILIQSVAATVIQLAISRSREYKADFGSAQLTHNPEGLAGALEKLSALAKRIPLPASRQTAHLFIVSPLSGRSLLALFSTHPPLEERVARLRAMKLS